MAVENRVIRLGITEKVALEHRLEGGGVSQGLWQGKLRAEGTVNGSQSMVPTQVTNVNIIWKLTKNTHSQAPSVTLVQPSNPPSRGPEVP